MKPAILYLIPILLILTGVFLRILLAINAYDYFIDDAYIFMRYCDNAVNGHGLVYNLGERVMGYTSISFALISTSLQFIFRNVAQATLVQCFNMLLFLISAFTLFSLCDREHPIRYCLPAAFVLYFPMVDASLNGMETALFCALACAVLSSINRESFVSACLWATVATGTRPEGLFLLIPCLVALFLKSRRHLMWMLLVLLMITALCGSALWFYYGSFVPHSIIAKSSLSNASSWAGIITSPLQKAVLLAIGASDNVFFTFPFVVRIALSILTIVTILFATLNMKAIHNRRPEALIAGAFYVLVLAFYITGNPVRIFSWYTIPTCLCFLVVLFASIEVGLDQLRLKHLQPYIVIAAILISALSIYVALPRRMRTIANHVGDLHNLAENITIQFPYKRSVMIADIGIVGYTTRMQIIDLAGLVSPAVIERDSREPLSIGALAKRIQPDIICLKQNPLNRRTIVESSVKYRSFDNDQQSTWFQNHYIYTNMGSAICPHVFIVKDP